MSSKLLIIGASGHGKVVAEIASKMKRWQTIAFLDDNELLIESMGLKVLGKSDGAKFYMDDYDIFVGIGNNGTREKIQDKLELEGAVIPVLIHPSAIIGEEVLLHSGTVVMAGVVINCCCNIGKGSIINTGSTIDHDNVLGDYVHISPGAHLAGTVSIGNKSWLGVGSIVSNNINITSDCIVGSGAVVVKDIAEPGTYVGIPVKRIGI